MMIVSTRAASTACARRALALVVEDFPVGIVRQAYVHRHVRAPGDAERPEPLRRDPWHIMALGCYEHMHPSRRMPWV